MRSTVSPRRSLATTVEGLAPFAFFGSSAESVGAFPGDPRLGHDDSRRIAHDDRSRGWSSFDLGTPAVEVDVVVVVDFDVARRRGTSSCFPSNAARAGADGWAC